MHWIWRCDLAEQPVWGQLHVWVSSALVWTVLPCQQPRDAHAIFPHYGRCFLLWHLKYSGWEEQGWVGTTFSLKSVSVGQAALTCLSLRWEGCEEGAAAELCPSPVSPTCHHSQPLPARGSATVVLWWDITPSIPAAELQLEEPESEILLQDLALCLHTYPQQRRRCLKWQSRSCANVSLKNDISSWSSDPSIGLEMSTSRHHSLVFGQIVLFGK